MVSIKFKKLNGLARIPEYQTAGSAGADLRSVEYIELLPGDVKAVDLGFSVEIPEGYEIQIRPRSGLALNHSITILNAPGTVDSDYRGPMKAILANMGRKTFFVNPGDRIAQMVVSRVAQGYFEEVELLGDTERGEGGFGHSGVK